MSGPREAAAAALFALISGAYAWVNTPARRLKMIGDVPAEQRPAFFQSEHGPEAYQWVNSARAKRTLDVSLYFYVKSDDDAPGAPQLNAILDAVEAALQPSAADAYLGRQTGGGSAFQFRIKSVPFRIPGDLDGDGLLVVTVEIILP